MVLRMSGKVSFLRNILGTLFSEGDEEAKNKFIYFWDDILIDDIENEEGNIRGFIEILKDNRLIIMTFLTIVFAIIPLVFSIKNDQNGVIISTIGLVLIIVITYMIHYNNFQKPFNLLYKKSLRFKEKNFVSEDEFAFGVSSNEVVVNFNEFRRDMNKTIRSVQQNMRDINYQITIIENKFNKTSSSLGMANLSFDNSLSNVGNYQELKGYVNLSSSGVDSFTSAFDEAIVIIGDVSKQLRSLGKQIQMLALNAGIEAARSGELGIGFEVVASNLRRLSQHITQSSITVKNQIAEVSDHAKQSLELITESMNALATHVDETHSITTSIHGNVGASSRDFNNVQTNYDELVALLRNVDTELQKFNI